MTVQWTLSKSLLSFRILPTGMTDVFRKPAGINLQLILVSTKGLRERPVDETDQDRNYLHKIQVQDWKEFRFRSLGLKLNRQSASSALRWMTSQAPRRIIGRHA
jgi:hypothetical protein